MSEKSISYMEQKWPALYKLVNSESQIQYFDDLTAAEQLQLVDEFKGYVKFSADQLEECKSLLRELLNSYTALMSALKGVVETYDFNDLTN